MFLAVGAAMLIGSVLYIGYSGFVLFYMWAWFMVPFGVKPITLPFAIVLCTIISGIKGWPANFEDGKSVWFTLLKPYIYVTLFLVLGYIAHCFI